MSKTASTPSRKAKSPSSPDPKARWELLSHTEPGLTLPAVRGPRRSLLVGDRMLAHGHHLGSKMLDKDGSHARNKRTCGVVARQQRELDVWHFGKLPARLQDLSTHRNSRLVQTGYAETGEQCLLRTSNA